MDKISDDQLALLVIQEIVEILKKDFDKFMPKWQEVQGLSVRFKDIKEPENDYFEILYN